MRNDNTCPYCNDHDLSDGKNFIFNVQFQVFIQDWTLSMYVNGDRLVVATSPNADRYYDLAKKNNEIMGRIGGDIATSTHIRYCPMCGRLLT